MMCKEKSTWTEANCWNCLQMSYNNHNKANSKYHLF